MCFHQLSSWLRRMTDRKAGNSDLSIWQAVSQKWMEFVTSRKTNHIISWLGIQSFNYIMLMQEIEGDTNKWKYILGSWIGGNNIVKMDIVPKAIYRFNAISIKTPNSIFMRIRKNNHNICMKLLKTLKG